ncbi:MAG: undecaprenyldiphospho-muramoylpentapeptide beta-N-acetylglucosaminyltransferase [Firmicutes bacterium]|nr:undecaprenyldiphospho-muramoylpentapeptide beta-N-acetylglucosaminyltransferase [Bacillota bacterium]
MKAVISGGGTGGHIYPALSIAQRLRADGVEILYVGGKASVEAKLAARNGFAFFGLDCAGLHRRSLAIIKDLLTNARGLLQARSCLRDFQPDVVIGTGGYAEAPVLKAAQNMGIPTLLHEQNAYPGLANRTMARKAKAVCLTFQAAAPYFPHADRLHLTGLPIREQIFSATREAAREYFQIPDDGKPTLLITGGSQGAAALNNAAAEAMESLLEQGIRVIHICGEKEYSSRKQHMPKHPDLLLRPYIEQMEFALALADLAVSRAGASFIAEALAVGLPTILVPYPYAANDHQRFNALALQEKGAGILVENDALNGKILLEQVLSLLQDDEKRQEMSANCRAMAVPDAAGRIAGIVYDLLK